MFGECIQDSAAVPPPRQRREEKHGSFEIALADLPPELCQKLRHLDLSGDGFIDISEIASLEKTSDEAKKSNQFLRQVLFVGALLWVLQIVAIFALSYGAVQAGTPYFLDVSGKMVSKQGGSVQTSSADMCIENGNLLVRLSDGSCPIDTPSIVKTSPASAQSFLSSELSDEYFESLQKLSLVSPIGNLVQLTVDAFMRNVTDQTVILSTPFGTIVVGESYYTAKDWDNKRPFFASAGFNETVWFSSPHHSSTDGRRRLRDCLHCPVGTTPTPAPSPKIPTSKPTSFPTFKYLPTSRPTAQYFDKNLWVVQGFYSGWTTSCDKQCKNAGFSACDLDQASTLTANYPQSWVSAVWPKCTSFLVSNEQYPYAIAPKQNPTLALGCFTPWLKVREDYCTRTFEVGKDWLKTEAFYPFCACKK